jgi:hypothetical protein
LAISELVYRVPVSSEPQEGKTTPAAAMAANCRNFRRSKPVIMVSYLKIFQCQVDHIFGADTTGTESPISDVLTAR